jgi:hypothetical protein
VFTGRIKNKRVGIFCKIIRANYLNCNKGKILKIIGLNQGMKSYKKRFKILSNIENIFQNPIKVFLILKFFIKNIPSVHPLSSTHPKTLFLN